VTIVNRIFASNKRVTCFGYGKTTAAIAKKFGNCDIYDDKFEHKEEFGTNSLNPMEDFDPAKSKLEIISPGVPPSNEYVKKARNLISEYDLFAENMPFSIWISGTNGKTTTTQMLQKLLEKRGSVCGGNIGTPLAELDEEAKIWILETSSFTLHYTKEAKPNIYLLLPVSADHISWHGSFKEYAEAKLKPLAAMQEGELAIIPAEFKEYVKSDAYIVYYDNSSDLTDYFNIQPQKLKFKEPFLLDAVMALAVQKTLFNEADYDLINSFDVDPHKLQEIRDKNGNLWVDDSKATNLDATLSGLKSYKEMRIHLILGGDDKGADLKPLFDELKNYDLKIYAIGKNRSKIASLSSEYDIECQECGFLEIAVDRIARKIDKKSAGILSPACASLDQFSSYKERGEKFQKFISDL